MDHEIRHHRTTCLSLGFGRGSRIEGKMSRVHKTNGRPGNQQTAERKRRNLWIPEKPSSAPGGGGWGVLPYKGLMGTCGQPGYVFRDFCLKQGIEFIVFGVLWSCIQTPKSEADLDCGCVTWRTR